MILLKNAGIRTSTLVGTNSISGTRMQEELESWRHNATRGWLAAMDDRVETQRINEKQENKNSRRGAATEIAPVHVQWYAPPAARRSGLSKS